MATVFKPPAPVPHSDLPTVFLAGSIDMGHAEDWQSRVSRELADLDVRLLNPRRDDWDSSWTQEYANHQFREQVDWELAGLEQATLVVMYFAAGSQSPITLLELGLCARSRPLVVCCPVGFWRRGNVEVLCRRYGISLVETLEDLISEVRTRLGGSAKNSQTSP